jgi:hypothetical protein
LVYIHRPCHPSIGYISSLRWHIKWRKEGKKKVKRRSEEGQKKVSGW